MRNLPERVFDSIRKRNLFSRGERILIAVSGGVDSMVLLQVLNQLSADQGWTLIVAHFNHQLRGRSSDADERLVKTIASKLGVRYCAGRGDVKTQARRGGISIEMSARELRHRFLARTAKRWRCGVIATAHHADDQVELFFLRLSRGAGGGGASGMQWKSIAPADCELKIVRPLLALTKSDLVAYAKSAAIVFREDVSNRSTDILRNRVRLELLPLLRSRFNPSVDRTVVRLMEIIGDESDLVSVLADEWLRSKRGSFEKLHVAVQRRVIQEQVQGLSAKFDFELIESLRVEHGKKISVASGIWLERSEAGIVSKTAPPGRSFLSEESVLNLVGDDGSARFSGVDFAWEYLPWDGKSVRNVTPGQEAFDGDKIGGRILLRHWRAGDRFQPIGMKVAVKLQDLFTNQKVSPSRRRESVVAESERGGIFWVEGLRIGECCKLTGDTRRTLVWRWQRQ